MQRMAIASGLLASIILLSGCAAETDNSESAPSENTETEASSSPLVQYLRGEPLEGVAPATADTLAYWTDKTDEEILTAGETSCTIIGEAVKNIEGTKASRTDAIFDTFIAQLDKIADPTLTYEETEAAILVLGIADSAALILCPEYASDTVAAVAKLEELSGPPPAEEDTSGLSLLEDYNLEVSSWVDQYRNPETGVIDWSEFGGVLFTISDDERTLINYADLNANSVIEEGENIWSLTLPEEFSFSFEAKGNPTVGSSYAEPGIEIETLTVVES